MSLLADPDVISSMEPTADWETCSFGSASEGTLGGWALTLVFGIFPSLGSEKWTEDESDFPFINLLPSVYTECRPEHLIQVRHSETCQVEDIQCLLFTEKLNPLLLNEHQYLMPSPRRQTIWPRRAGDFILSTQ